MTKIQHSEIFTIKLNDKLDNFDEIKPDNRFSCDGGNWLVGCVDVLSGASSHPAGSSCWPVTAQLSPHWLPAAAACWLSVWLW